MRRLSQLVVLAVANLLLAVIAPLLPTITVFADDHLDCPNNDPTHCVSQTDLNSIKNFSPWNDPRDQTGDTPDCTAAAVAGASFTGFLPDPQAVAVYNNQMKAKIAELAPLYQKAAQAEKVPDWEILAGVHEIEHGLSRTNVTNSFGFMTPFQMGPAEIRGAGGDPSDPRLANGHTLTDDEFVYVARLSLRILKGKASDKKYVNVDISKPMTPQDIAKVTIAYNTGQGTVPELKNTSPYAWAGFNSSNFKLPMQWANGNTFNQTPTFNVPGAVTTVGLIRNSGDLASAAPTDSDCQGTGAPSTDTAPSYCADGTATGGQKSVCYAYLFDHYDYNDPGCRGSADKLTTTGPHGECKNIAGVKGLLAAVQTCNDNNFGDGCTLPKFSPIIDCSSMVDAAIYGGVGVDLGGAATGGYPGNPHLEEIDKTAAGPGDIVWFNGHTELIVLNNTKKKYFYTFGAHQSGVPNEQQVGPSGYSYGEVLKTFHPMP